MVCSPSSLTMSCSAKIYVRNTLKSGVHIVATRQAYNAGCILAHLFPGRWLVEKSHILYKKNRLVLYKKNQYSSVSRVKNVFLSFDQSERLAEFAVVSTGACSKLYRSCGVCKASILFLFFTASEHLFTSLSTKPSINDPFWKEQ